MQKQILRGMLSVSMVILIAGSVVFTAKTEAVESTTSDSEGKTVPLTHMDVLKEYKKRRDSRAKQLARKAAQMVNPNTGVAYFDNPSPLMSPLKSGYCECSCNATASNTVAPVEDSFIDQEDNNDKRNSSDQVPSTSNENKSDSDNPDSQKDEGGNRSVWPLNKFTG